MRLSPRQEQILELVAQGCSDKEIARRLNMSARTVGTHLSRLYARYQVHSRSAVIAMWIRSGR